MKRAEPSRLTVQVDSPSDGIAGSVEITAGHGSTLTGWFGEREIVADQVDQFDDFHGLAKYLREEAGPEVGYLFHVEVARAKQHQGLGRSMVERALEVMRQGGASAVYAHVASWVGSERFLAKLGFDPVDCCPDDGGFDVMVFDSWEERPQLGLGKPRPTVLEFRKMSPEHRMEIQAQLGRKNALTTRWKFVPDYPIGEAVSLAFRLALIDGDRLDRVLGSLRAGGLFRPILIDVLKYGEYDDRSWIEGAHRSVAAEDLGRPTIPAFIRVK